MDLFYTEGGETVKKVAWKSSGFSITGSVHVQFGQGSEQPDLVKDIPAHGRRLGLDGC